MSQKTAIRRAVFDGLTESVGALSWDGQIPGVFPGNPYEKVRDHGSVWLTGARSKFEVRALGNHASNQKETVTVSMSFFAYREGATASAAVEAAEERVEEMFSAFVAWAKANQDLGGVCTHCLLGEDDTDAHAVDGGWCVLTTFHVVAACHPSFTG